MAYRDFPWTSQPQEWVRPNRGTAFFDKLLLLNHGIYGDVLNNSPPIYSGDVALTRGVGGAGPRPRLDGSFPGFAACPIDPVLMSGDYTLMVYTSAHQLPAPNVNTQTIELTPVAAATSLGMRIGATGARALLDNNLSAIVSGDFRAPSVFAGVRRGNQGNFYVDGHLAAPPWTTGTRAGYVTGSSTGPRTGNNGDNGAITYLQAVWDRALSEQEIRALGNNPWQLFEPQRIWVPSLGAAPEPVSLAIASSRQRHSATAAPLRTGAALALASARQAHTVQTPALSIALTLAPQKSKHAHRASAQVLAAGNALAIASATSRHRAAHLTLGDSRWLAVARAAHKQRAATPAISGGDQLAVAPGRLRHRAAAANLSSQVLLSVQGAAQAHRAAAPVVGIGLGLALASARHAHRATAPALMLGQVALAIANAWHLHRAGQPALGGGGAWAPSLTRRVAYSVPVRVVRANIPSRRVIA